MYIEKFTMFEFPNPHLVIVADLNQNSQLWMLKELTVMMIETRLGLYTLNRLIA